MGTQNEQEFVFYSEKLNYKSQMGAKGKEYFVEGYISTGDMDLVNDIVTKSCMDDMMTQFDGRSIKLDFEHETFRGKSAIDAEANKTRIPLGKAISKDRDAKGVKVKWQMNPTWKKFDAKGNVTMDFKDIWQNIESEMYDAFSIAYVPTKTTSMQQQGKSVRMLENINLLNVALTGNPINPLATMSAVMAKSLAFMKDNEDPEEFSNVEIKDSIIKIEGAIKSIKSNLSGEKADKNVGYTKMVKTKDEEVPEAVAESPETPVEAGEEAAVEEAGEAVAEAEAPAEAEAKPEGKSITLAEMKSVIETLTKDVDVLKKENSELKAIVEKPLQKSKGAENKSEAKSQETADVKSFGGPMDLIA